MCQAIDDDPGDDEDDDDDDNDGDEEGEDKEGNGKSTIDNGTSLMTSLGNKKHSELLCQPLPLRHVSKSILMVSPGLYCETCMADTCAQVCCMSARR